MKDNVTELCISYNNIVMELRKRVRFNKSQLKAWQDETLKINRNKCYDEVDLYIKQYETYLKVLEDVLHLLGDK